MNEERNPIDKPQDLNEVARFFLVMMAIAAVVAVVVLLVGTHYISHGT